jgi:hypothetical protein
MSRGLSCRHYAFRSMPMTSALNCSALKARYEPRHRLFFRLTSIRPANRSNVAHGVDLTRSLAEFSWAMPTMRYLVAALMRGQMSGMSRACHLKASPPSANESSPLRRQCLGCRNFDQQRFEFEIVAGTLRSRAAPVRDDLLNAGGDLSGMLC